VRGHSFPPEGTGNSVKPTKTLTEEPFSLEKMEFGCEVTCPQGKILTVEKKSEDGKKCKYSNEAACASCKNKRVLKGR